ncbi:unnamed protein product [Diamesa hyperborea]
MHGTQGFRCEHPGLQHAPTLQHGEGAIEHLEGLGGQHLHEDLQDILQEDGRHGFEEHFDILQHDDLQTIAVHGGGQGSLQGTLHDTLHGLLHGLHLGLDGLLHRILQGLGHGLLQGVAHGLLHGEAHRLDLDLFLNKGILLLCKI